MLFEVLWRDLLLNSVCCWVQVELTNRPKQENDLEMQSNSTLFDNIIFLSVFFFIFYVFLFCL